MAEDKPKTREISWQSVVDEADPKRKDPKVCYEFSNGRKFKEGEFYKEAT